RRLIELDDAAPALLQPLEAPARALAPGAGARPARHWCEQLLRSLQALPLWTHWPADAAGAALVDTLQQLEGALRDNPLRMTWAEFRKLLERALETATFSSAQPQSRVRLLTLEQARGLSCDALILAGAAAGSFPSAPPALVLFNHAVRAELGLGSLAQDRDIALARFRGLLEAAPDVLITWAPPKPGEPAEPCAWAGLLQACGAGSAPELAHAAGSAAVEVARHEELLPACAPAPRPPAPVDLLPPQMSASAHQQLVDCPYRYYAGEMLGLSQPQEPDQPYSGKDFGERVHAVLQRYTQEQAGPLTAASAAQAARRLEEIGREVFARDLAARVLAQAWLAQFIDLVPRLVAWMCQRSADWPQAVAEQKLRLALTPALEIHGRADRVERNARGELCVVDYKTGSTPGADDITSGEAVQAVHYALLAPQCTRIEYLPLGRDEKKLPVVVEGEALAETRSGVRTRLLQLHAQLAAGAALPANGEDHVCDFCVHAGLCRKGAWNDD
ncbi:MAG TPA: PD-(D/E)XK nuclease family protein, partial [Nevskiaceae bacterium]|nr:PD-(D/E)XK nuclease family protein [Nevskiaceae bacterium]